MEEEKFNPLKILIEGSPERNTWKFLIKENSKIVDGIRLEIDLMIDKRIENIRFAYGMKRSQEIENHLDFKLMIKNLFDSYNNF